MKKQTLTLKDTEKIAKLANLKLTPDEIEKFTKQLSAVLGYVEKLNEVNTDKVATTSQVTGLVNVTRPDEIDSKRIIKKAEHYKVKAIFE